MEFAARGNRDNPRLPPLSLGLSSVRLIVNKIEAEYARAAASSAESNLELVKYDPNVDEGYDDYHDPPLDTSKGRVWSRFAVNLGVALSRCIPSVSFWNFGVVAVAASFIAPKMISYLLLYPFCRLVFGTLYPAYASYKAVRTKNLKEYVKWMMYWIVFALFTCTETFTDVFLSWFPFYYEVKIVLVLWLLSPATKGSSILYRKFVHPALCRREQEIDEYIAKAKDQGYHTVLNLGTKGVNYATTVIMQTAIKGGGGLVQQLRKSYSLSDLSECDPRGENALEADDVLTEPRTIRRAEAKSGYNTRRSASESNSRSPIYFPEVDLGVNVRGGRTKDEPDFGHIKSSEDISSGYSSADNSASLTRAGSLSAASRAKLRSRTTVTTIKRPQAAEDEVIIEELHDDDSFEFANMPPLLNLPQNLYLSNSDPPFIYQLVGDQVRIIQVLGSNNPNTPKLNNENDDTDRWDQNKANEDASPTVDDVHYQNKDIPKAVELKTSVAETSHKCQELKDLNKEAFQRTEDNNNIPIETDIKDNNLYVNVPILIESDTAYKESDESAVTKQDDSLIETETLREKNIAVSLQPKSTSQNGTGNQTTEQVQEKPNLVKVEVDAARTEPKTDEDPIESTSLDTSLNDNDNDDSDDEASFGTPEGSPKSKRKSPVGKYGKKKAPLPPLSTSKTDADRKEKLEGDDCKFGISSQESLIDIVKKLPEKGFKETGTKSLQIINPIAEKKRRHKSKSPGRIPKTSASGIGKLLQLPGKLAFWSKTDDKKNKDNVSTSSEDRSRRSSTIEKTDDFQSCNALNEFSDINNREIADDQLSFKDAEFVETEIISHDIIEKSDELQKLIEAKIESHPEYKFVSLHEEVATTSKSTDV